MTTRRGYNVPDKSVENKIRTYIKEHPMQVPLHEISAYLKSNLYAIGFRSGAALMKSVLHELFPIYKMKITVSSKRIFEEVLLPEMQEIAKLNACTVHSVHPPTKRKHEAPRKITCYDYELDMFFNKDHLKKGVEVIMEVLDGGPDDYR